MDLMNRLHLFATLLAAFINCSHSANTDSSSEAGPNDINYGMLLDAGSSSSKLKLYNWILPMSHSVPPKVTLFKDKEFTTSLSSLYGRPGEVREYVETILRWAKGQIPAHKHSSSPIYVLATAGMRYLHSDHTTGVLSLVYNALANASTSPFALVDPVDVNVLSGEEEAIYAWIAVNYLLGFFHGERSHRESAGVLEMGGGSTQIAFVPKGPLYAEEFQVRFAGGLHSVYVQSYLQLGANGINIKVANALRKQQNISDGSDLEDPCLLKGDATQFKFRDDIKVYRRGTGSPNDCRLVLEGILKSVSAVDCHPKPCSIGRVYQPSVENIVFYATQAFVYGPRNLGALPSDGNLNMSLLLNKASVYCQKTLSEVLKDPKVNAKYASADCLAGLYVPALLQSYGFGLDTKNIKVTSKIGSSKIDWALGAMLVKLSDRINFGNRNDSEPCLGGSRENSAWELNARTSFYKIYSISMCVSVLFIIIRL